MARRKKDDTPPSQNHGDIEQETFDAVTAALEAKGLDPDLVPAEFADSQSLKSRELGDLTETKGQALLARLNEIPDDQPVEPDNADDPNGANCAAADNNNDDPDNASGNGEAKDDIRKAEDLIWVKRPLTTDERQAIMDDLYELAERRRTLEFELDGHKNKAKACQKEIEGIDSDTYRIIRESEANAVEEEVSALRITNHSTGMITWYDRGSGEVLKERAINSGEQLPLDLAGEAADSAADGSDAKPDTVHLHGSIIEKNDISVRFLVCYIDRSESETETEIDIPHEQIVNLRNRVLTDEPDGVIVARAYAIEVGLITAEADNEAEEQSEDSEPMADVPQNSDEKGCSVCAHRDAEGDSCQNCGDNLENFTPLDSNSMKSDDSLYGPEPTAEDMPF